MYDVVCDTIPYYLNHIFLPVSTDGAVLQGASFYVRDQHYVVGSCKADSEWNKEMTAEFSLETNGSRVPCLTVCLWFFLVRKGEHRKCRTTSIYVDVKSV